MEKINKDEVISELVRTIKFDPPPKDIGGTFITRPGIKFYIHSTDKMLHDEYMSKLWNYNNEIYTNLTYKEFQDRMISFLISREFKPEPKDNDAFFREILDLKIRKWDVLKPLFGATIPDECNKLEFGPYTLYKIEKSNSDTIEELPDHLRAYMNDEINMTTMFDSLTNIFIAVTIENRSGDRAAELSEEKFNQFEIIMKYLIGEHPIFDVRIESKDSWKETYAVCHEDGAFHNNSQRSAPFSQIDMSTPFFTENEVTKWIWNKIDAVRLTDMESRILAAIMWVGKGINDVDHSNKFIQYMFALESLFTYQKRGELVSPSIANQISEFSAFVLKESSEERKGIVRMVKNLYGTRSAIAHGRSHSISNEELNDACNLVRSLVDMLIKNEELKHFSEFTDLLKWVDEKKFS
ncbi:hypothetical protein FHS19_006826 [Paenibacillus rhizosphaerae]|uniref:Apea-like HEPN domain-containing protein n=1 Tax=Paenibacillus rhizosphaerae TaxID=297318 RepID=A0A839U3R6_9BACL|nr:HEPN domain-containing protein [Paenibacillus rhizosphaerae]MBB3132099.1 hypothetical protein [Paenibacillus rhizosphaerae]